MSSTKIHIGTTPRNNTSPKANGEFVTRDEMEFYKISNHNQMRAFFISLISHSDHWLFISSLGGLTAGRKNPDNALFPYSTDDKIHDDYEKTGSKTCLLYTSPSPRDATLSRMPSSA